MARNIRKNQRKWATWKNLENLEKTSEKFEKKNTTAASLSSLATCQQRRLAPEIYASIGANCHILRGKEYKRSVPFFRV